MLSWSFEREKAAWLFEVFLSLLSNPLSKKKTRKKRKMLDACWMSVWTGLISDARIRKKKRRKRERGRREQEEEEGKSTNGRG
jgi:hypothetical protein